MLVFITAPCNQRCKSGAKCLSSAAGVTRGMNQEEIVREIIDTGRRLDRLGFVPATDGNISVRMSEREIVATATGVRKGSLSARDCVVIDPDGRVLRGSARPSSEILMHLAVYRARPDARAVVHAHPPTATGFAVAGLPLHQCVLPEVVATIGSIPIAPYATPSTDELPRSLAPLIEHHDAVLLANHGAVTFAPDLFQAMNRMETVEQFARILFVARTLGRVNVLSGAQVEQINAIRHRYGFEGHAPGCEACREERPFTDHDLLAARAGTVVTSCARGGDPAPDPDGGVSQAPAESSAPEDFSRDELVQRVAAEVARILESKRDQ